jgi:transcription antitermination factor NusG
MSLQSATLSALGISVVSLGVGAGALGRSLQNKSDIDNLNTQIGGIRDSTVSLIAAVEGVSEIVEKIIPVTISELQIEIKSLEKKIVILPVDSNLAEGEIQYEANLERFQVITGFGDEENLSVVLPANNFLRSGDIISIANGLNSNFALTKFENLFNVNQNVRIENGSFMTFVYFQDSQDENKQGWIFCS